VKCSARMPSRGRPQHEHRDQAPFTGTLTHLSASSLVVFIICKNIRVDAVLIHGGRARPSTTASLSGALHAVVPLANGGVTEGHPRDVEHDIEIKCHSRGRSRICARRCPSSLSCPRTPASTLLWQTRDASDLQHLQVSTARFRRSCRPPVNGVHQTDAVARSTTTSRSNTVEGDAYACGRTVTRRLPTHCGFVAHTASHIESNSCTTFAESVRKRGCTVTVGMS